MLFADELPPWVSFLSGTVLTSVVGSVGAAAVWWFTRKDRKEKEIEAREDQEEETALKRLENVMRLREEDCERRINELTVRVTNLERNRDAKQIERDALRDKLALYAARTKYLEALLRRSGVTPDDWEKPDTAPDGLPAVDTTPREN